MKAHCLFEQSGAFYKGVYFMTAKERVEQELKELEEKQLKLGVFIENELFAKMTEEEQRLLVYQYRIMGRYAMILKHRLKIWREL